MKKFICTLALITLATAPLAGCTYYRVSHPESGRVYYTTGYQNRGGGAIAFTDAGSGDRVTLQSSEVEKINKTEYDRGRLSATPQE